MSLLAVMGRRDLSHAAKLAAYAVAVSHKRKEATTVRAMADCVGVSTSTMERGLAELRDHHLLASTPEGRRVRYAISVTADGGQQALPGLATSVNSDGGTSVMADVRHDATTVNGDGGAPSFSSKRSRSASTSGTTKAALGHAARVALTNACDGTFVEIPGDFRWLCVAGQIVDQTREDRPLPEALSSAARLYIEEARKRGFPPGAMWFAKWCQGRAATHATRESTRPEATDPQLPDHLADAWAREGSGDQGVWLQRQLTAYRNSCSRADQSGTRAPKPDLDAWLRMGAPLVHPADPRATRGAA